MAGRIEGICLIPLVYGPMNDAARDISVHVSYHAGGLLSMGYVLRNGIPR